MPLDAQPKILLRGGASTKNFFAQKLSNLDPILNKLMQLQRVTDGDQGVEP